MSCLLEWPVISPVLVQEQKIHCICFARNGGNKFKKVRCQSEVCALKKTNRVDKWQRCPQDVDNTIKAWLAHSVALKKDPCPHTMTVELYKSQIVPERPSTMQGTQRRFEEGPLS